MSKNQQFFYIYIVIAACILLSMLLGCRSSRTAAEQSVQAATLAAADTISTATSATSSTRIERQLADATVADTQRISMAFVLPIMDSCAITAPSGGHAAAQMPMIIGTAYRATVTTQSTHHARDGLQQAQAVRADTARASAAQQKQQSSAASSQQASTSSQLLHLLGALGLLGCYIYIFRSRNR